MSRLDMTSWSRACPRVAVLALVGVLAAGCSDSARFDSNPYASNPRQPPSDVTGSIARRPAPASRIASQPLPAPTRPATVAAAGYSGGYANGGQSLGAYRPGERRTDVTGSVAERRAPAPAGHWTWDGGAPIIVGHGQTLEAIARKYGVPMSAIMQVNNISNPRVIVPGQRLVIPRYVAASAAPVGAAAPAPQRHAEGDIHVVSPGETMLSISRRHHISLTALARANRMQPYTKLEIGQRLTIPGGERRVAEMRPPAPAPVPRVAEPRTVPAQAHNNPPQQNARIAKVEAEDHDSVTKTVEPAGGIPSFRWPVHGRIIAGYGAKPNGVANDGINVAVPEGTAIKAADDGVVAYAGNELKGYGNLVLIRHANGYVSAYANASELLVKRGDSVKRGQVIARAGQTGNVTSPQLHFEIRKGSVPVDPTKYLGGA